jgi:hypothetical protein
MSRPNPIEYAERLYAAIRDANFSPISFLAFGNAIKDRVAMRNMPRIAAEPFMRVVGDMLNLEEEADRDLIDAEVLRQDVAVAVSPEEPEALATRASTESTEASCAPSTESAEMKPATALTSTERRRGNSKRGQQEP